MIKVGDWVYHKQYPLRKGKVVEIKPTVWAGYDLATVKNGTRFVDGVHALELDELTTMKKRIRRYEKYIKTYLS
jgi:hypothetical protein